MTTISDNSLADNMLNGCKEGASEGETVVDAQMQTDAIQQTLSKDGTNQKMKMGIVDKTLKENNPVERKLSGAEISNSNFLLKGKLFKNVRCLSDSSGEAQIFLVSNDGREFVLKLYYPNYKSKKKITKIIVNFDFEMVIKLFDFGRTYVDGCQRDYELMEYLKGGTFKEYRLNGDMKQFRRIALQCAAALAYCHNNHIIHKDIKPSNFFFRDSTYKEIVLGDFGISSLCSSDEDVASHRTTQARTPAYAAPEMYNDVIDGVVEISSAVDFYSLGITLFTLWLGRNPLSSNERDMMRQKNEGRLPHIKELPENVRMIIQGLTSVNPQRRWGYDEVEKWFKGEHVEVDTSSPFLKYKSFVVDPDRNLIAENIHDLIPILYENRKLAMFYLYNKRLSAWLEECGNTKLNAVLDNIVDRRYPIDQNAGLMAAIYAMEPKFPYYDIHGNECDDTHSVAMALLNYQSEYALELKDTNSLLFIYIEAHFKCDVDRIRSYFIGNDVDGRVAILRTVYEIDADIPFLAKYPSSTLKDISLSFGSYECSDDEWKSLSDGRLLSWMYSHVDKTACESLRIFTEGREYTRSLSYEVLYNINRDSAFDLNGADTVEKIGQIFNERLQECQQMNDEEFKLQLDDFVNPEGRLFYFAQLHGWNELVSEGKHCFDLKSDENRERLGAYDIKTAAYKFCMILGVTPSYMLQDGKILEDGLKIEKKDMRQIRTEIRNGNFCQWLSIFYHENPQSDFLESYSYERSLERYLIKLGDFDMAQPYYKRFVAAKADTEKKTAEAHRTWKKASAKEKNWKMTFYVIVVLWILLLAVVGISNKPFFVDHVLWTVGFPVGVCTGIIVAVREYFKGFGISMSILFGLLAMLTAAIPAFLLKYIYNYMPSLLLFSVILLSVVYAIICHFSDIGKHKTDMASLNEALDDDINSTLIEPLYYTFKTKSYKYKGSKFSALEDISNQVSSLAGETIIHYLLWSVFFLVLILELVFFSPRIINARNPNFEQLKSDYQQLIKQIKDVK
jgi:serine/threonine protein kinase